MAREEHFPPLPQYVRRRPLALRDQATVKLDSREDTMTHTNRSVELARQVLAEGNGP